ncbi:DUF4762 domain-containing protein, partial [Salmonella enterica]|nr:DUF4762 domain-containing protein [Salmonella enterica]EEP7586970.1 DUF4762 domain-containing protein [Salmonella enterica]EGH1809405.1 DUF4762 domain-containing protein [Salmonella enterica]EJD2342884.1 DUF4762 family protein [Salmonella enterica]
FMKKISNEQATVIVGGDDCYYTQKYVEYRSNGTKACVGIYQCFDKHGEPTSTRKDDLFWYDCQ